MSSNSAPPELLTQLFEIAVASADPAKVIGKYLPHPPKGRTIVLGAGKASAAMASAFETVWSGSLEGLVITRYGHDASCAKIEIIEAAHPIPDQTALEASKRILEIAQSAGSDDLIVCLISGGGSSLLTLPAANLTLEDKQIINENLLRSGATINEVNCVRKHLSAIKGGRLALASDPAQVVTLYISDVPGDDPSVIASGPTVPDPTTSAEALALLERLHIDVPQKVKNWLVSTKSESPKADNPIFQSTRLHMIATPQMALEAAAAFAHDRGVATHILGDAIEGEARDVALVHAGIVKQIKRHGQPFSGLPCVLLSGGETTVTIRGKGSGGPNVEFLLALAIALDGQQGVYAIACDTDGIDGAEEVAGAIITPHTLAKAHEKGLDPQAALDNNDAHSFFKSMGNQVITGPTLTNVNDFRAILIEK